jgi:hypothetical protein
MLEMRRPSVFGQNFSLKPGFFLFHEFQDSFIFILIQPIAVSTFTEIHFKVESPVLKSFHQLTTLGALAICGSGAEDQTTFLVVAEVEDFIFKLFQFLATQPHSSTGQAILKIDAVAPPWH